MVVLATAAACGGGGGGGGSDAQTQVSLRQMKGGSVLVDVSNHTLYTFSGGVDCTGECATTWPPLLADGSVGAKKDSGVNPDLLGTTERKDGDLQVTYDDDPVYLYSGDTSPGEAGGEGAHTFGGAWKAVRVVNPLAPQQTTGVSCEPNCGY